MCAATERPNIWSATVYTVIVASLAWCDSVHALQTAAPDRCAALARTPLRYARTVDAQMISSGRFEGPDGTRHEVPAFCRVHGELTPTAESRIAFELWLPASQWSRRYYQLGNGGFAGSIPYSELAAELRSANAVAAGDTGHRGDGFDASWARGSPQKVVDYGYRSVEATASAARALIDAYYGRPARYRYFVGCSNGGRQALMAAQRYPQLWDGILAGAPAYDWTRQLASFAAIQHALRSSPGGWIAPEKLPAIQRAALASCSAQARVLAGVPGDPRFCHFEPRALLCQGAQTENCLTAAQVSSLETIQSGPRAPEGGEPLYFGFEPTSAALPDNWQRWIVNADPAAHSQLTFAEQFYRHLVFDRSDWTLQDFRPERDFRQASETSTAGQPLAAVLDATSTDLTSLELRGAKLLMYIGWADAVVAPRAGVDYYERVSQRLGGFGRAQQFFRLFMVPGMTHCQGGPAPDAFGQSSVSPGLRDDAQHDIRRALEAWVEHGVAPKSLVAAKYVGDVKRRDVQATQLLCPYPQYPEPLRAGDPQHASSYACVEHGGKHVLGRGT